MGWLIEALANMFLEIEADLMSWTVSLITGLSLDIGMDSSTGPGPILQQVVPKVPKNNLFDNIFPGAANFTTLFMVMAGTIIVLLFFLKLMVSFGGPFVRSEGPGTIYMRTALAIGATAYSYSIFLMFEMAFNSIYSRFMQTYVDMTKDVENYSLGLGPNATTTNAAGNTVDPHVYQYMNGHHAEEAVDAYNMLSEKLIGSYQWGEGLGLTIITIALFAILITSFLRLVLEVYERYVMMGVLFYMAPLAASTLVSKELRVFSSWVQMVISEFIVMCSNLFFTGVFISAWHNILEAGVENECLFKDPQEFVSTMFIMISWLIIGQQIDQHMKSMGLATAQTGRGLGGAILAGLGTAGVMARAGLGAARSGARLAGKAAMGETGIQKAYQNEKAAREAREAEKAAEEAKQKEREDPSTAAGAEYFLNNLDNMDSMNPDEFKKNFDTAVKTSFANDPAAQAALREGFGTAGIESASYNEDGGATLQLENGRTASVSFCSAADNENVAFAAGKNMSVNATPEAIIKTSNAFAGKLQKETPQINGRNVTWMPDSTNPTLVTAHETSGTGAPTPYLDEKGKTVSIVTPAFEGQVKKYNAESFFI